MARQPLKLNQVIALEKGVKAEGERTLTQAYHAVKATQRWAGVERTYKPRFEDGEQLPPEGTKLQLRANDILDEVSGALSRWIDVQLTKDSGNQSAVADIVIGDEVIAQKVPVTFLLTLEKKLVDIHTFILNLPKLDPAERWEWDENNDAFVTVSQTAKTKKVPRNHVKAKATDKHPEQVEIFHEDIVVGDWTTTKLSGALPPAEVNALKNRVVALQEAVKLARETANATPAPDREVGEKIFDYLLSR